MCDAGALSYLSADGADYHRLCWDKDDAFVLERGLADGRMGYGSFSHFRAIGDTQAIARSKEHIEQIERKVELLV